MPLLDCFVEDEDSDERIDGADSIVAEFESVPVFPSCSSLVPTVLLVAPSKTLSSDESRSFGNPVDEMLSRTAANMIQTMTAPEQKTTDTKRVFDDVPEDPLRLLLPVILGIATAAESTSSSSSSSNRWNGGIWTEDDEKQIGYRYVTSNP